MARRVRSATRPAQRLILDSGAVIALSRHDQRARAAIAAALEAGAEVLVPAVVVAETVRGSAKDAPVNRVLKAAGSVVPATEASARTAGGLLGRAGSTSTAYALVVATAVEFGGGVVLTGDPDDVGPLADRHPEVVVEPL